MTNHTPEQLAAAKHYYNEVLSGRTRYEGQEPRHDEVILAELARLEADHKRLCEAIKADLKEWWSFDERQQHTHSWHTRNDFFEELDRAMAGKRSLLTHVPAAQQQAHNTPTKGQR